MAQQAPPTKRLFILFSANTASATCFSTIELSCPVAGHFSIPSPSDGHFPSTNSSFYPESNGEDDDEGCLRLQFLFSAKTASVMKFSVELSFPVDCNFSIPSPSNVFFHSTNSSFYPEFNGEKGDGG
jgi:hypothetical protein